MQIKIKRKKRNISLDKNESLIFFEILNKINELDFKNFNSAEKKFLWDMEAIFESQITEPFLENYSEIVKQAEVDFLNKI